MILATVLFHVYRTLHSSLSTFITNLFFYCHAGTKPELKTITIIFHLVALSFSATGQQDSTNFRQQAKFVCDNNFFLLNDEDGYYTSGMFLSYSRLLADLSLTSHKKIFSVEIGQEIYTAHSRKILPRPNIPLNIPGGLEQIDRPIAGYLFGRISYATFYTTRSMLELGISAGAIGTNSFAQDVQEYWHNVIGVKDYWNWVWEYQVENEFGVNLHGSFAYALLKPEQQSLFQITPTTQATLGTIYTNFSQSILFQLGRLRPLSSSVQWDSRVGQGRNTDVDNVEFFFLYKPELKYQLYNATIEGGMFNDNKDAILSDVNPLVLSNEIGLRFSLPRFSLGYSIVFQTREAKSQFHTQSYGSIVGSFCF